MTKQNTSPGRSFEGWKFGKWFKGNWKTIKEAIKVGLPLLVSIQFIDPLWAEFLATVVGKFVLDSGEFWFRNIKL